MQMHKNQEIRILTENEHDIMCEGENVDYFIEENCVACRYVHPEGFDNCATEYDDIATLNKLRECKHYADEEDAPDDLHYIACRFFYGMGFKGVCERAVYY